MRTGRATRGFRGLVAASVATTIALLSHLSGGGSMPGWVGVVVPLTLSLVVCTALAGRRVSLWRLTLAVGFSQFLFHALFVLGTFEPSAAAAPTGHHHMAAMSMAVDGSTSVPVSLAQSDVLMWAAHVVAAVVTIGALYRGERLALRLRELAGQLVAWVRRAVLEWSDAVLAPPARRMFARLDVEERPRTAVVPSGVRWRGPPRARVV